MKLKITLLTNTILLIETISENSISSGSRKRRQTPSNDRSFLDRILRAVENSVEWSGVGAGERCSGNVKCINGASCVNNYCRCISGVYVQVRFNLIFKLRNTSYPKTTYNVMYLEIHNVKIIY